MSKEELQKSKEQLEEEKRAILSQRIQPLTLEGMDASKLLEKARELQEHIRRLEGDKYDLEQRYKRQQYDVSHVMVVGVTAGWRWGGGGGGGRHGLVGEVVVVVAVTAWWVRCARAAKACARDLPCPRVCVSPRFDCSVYVTRVAHLDTQYLTHFCFCCR